MVVDRMQILPIPCTKGRCHGNPFCLSMGYNFGCMIASDTLFDSRGWVFGVKLSDEDIAEIECQRIVATATNFGTIIAINRLCVDDIDYAIG